MASIPCPTTSASRWPQFPAQQQEHQDALHSLPYSCLKTPSIIKQVMTFCNGKRNRNPVNLINLYIYNLNNIICRHNNKINHGVKKFVMSQICHYLKNLSWCQIYVVMSTNTSWHQQILHDLKKFVMTYFLCHNVKKFIMMSKSSSLRQKVSHDVKNISWYQKYVLMSKRSSWHQKVHHHGKKWVKTSNICQEVQKFVMTSQMLWCKKVHHYVKNALIFCHYVKNSSWHQTRGLSAW